ncbi:ComEC/Rec2 family competence protein [Mesonia sp. K7]|uniref:ComEC/Rec2 family competence protein n=1 Tax=Mesonia sp. K7 TaxID=2218606 RepID=UPI000DA95D3F|nr:ComEC/Rec2 family competence protein [Mesonia sp. K7]PZD77768.1 hypothetical protein DNG35_07990 [Mesonia sp. K7]
MKLLNIPIIIIVLTLLFGVILGYMLQISWIGLTILLGISFTFVGILHFSYQKYLPQKVLHYFYFLPFLVIGIFITKIHQEQQHQVAIKYNEQDYYHLKVKDQLKSNNYTHNYIAEARSASGSNEVFDILLSNFHDGEKAILKIGDQIYIKSAISKITKPKIPHQFDYGEHLHKKHVYGQIIFEENEIIIKESVKNLNTISADIRDQIETKLQENGFEPSEINFINAIVLGQKKELSKDVYNSFVDAGVIHILAVSGLHVGLILLILNFIFKPLRRNKFSNILVTFSIIAMLWFYAFLVGFSPSINRAVLMFSFLSLATIFKRKTHTLNLLALSAILLIVINPCVIYSIGFQLSYAAVFSIVTLHPVVYQKLKSKNKAFNYFTNIFCVTLTAQIGVLPISLYYFHQFPALFLVSNLVILPVLIFILGGLILTIICSLWFRLSDLWVETIEWIIQQLLRFIRFISSKDSLVFDQVYFSKTMLLLAIAALLFAVFAYYQKRVGLLFLSLLCIILMELSYLKDYLHLQNENHFYVFHESKNSMFAQQKGHRILFYGNNLKPYRYKNMLIEEQLNQIVIDSSIKNIFAIDDKKILVIDSSSVYLPAKALEIDFLVLKNSPKVNLERVISDIQPSYIIADGSNYFSYVNRWKATARNKKVPFHYTYEKGTFVIDY